MAEQGWMAVERPAEEGGLGLSLVEVAVLCEELGRRAAPVPYAETVICLDALGQAGPICAHRPGRRPLGPVGRADGRGGGVGCVAWSAGAARSPPVRMAKDGGSAAGPSRPTTHRWPMWRWWWPTGPSMPWPSTTAYVPRRSRPWTGPERWVGWSSTTPRLTESGRREGVERLTNRVATASAADTFGASARALEMSVEYAKVRRQFGHPIGSFQAVKHRLADALVDVEGMRSSTYYAAWCVATGDAEGSLAASMAKAWCSDASRRVTAAALQVHGGIGFTWDHDLHLFLKRAQADATGYGDAAWHRDRVAGLLAQRLASGGAAL